MTDQDLLRPSLSGVENVPSLYNSTGFFLSAFFGGPIGAMAYGMVNSRRLGRLAREWLPMVVFAAAGFGLFLALERSGLLGQLGVTASDRGLHGVCLRAIGLLVFGAIYLMHQRFYRAAASLGTAPIAGWAPGLAAVGIGWISNVAFLSWILTHH